MKKNILRISALFVGITLLFSCNNKRDKNTEAQTKNRTNPVVVTRDSCDDIYCRGRISSDLQGEVEAWLIRKMSLDYQGDPNKNYINNLCIRRDTGSDPSTARVGRSQDGLSVVFDLKKLKTLIYMIEKAQCSLKCDASFELGIRYYYVKYPCDLGSVKYRGTGLAGLPASLSNKHSLVMVPVYRRRGSTNWFDYNIWLNDSCYRSIFISGDPELNSFYGILPGNEGDGGDNHGGIGPPPGTGIFPTNEN